MKYHCFVFTLFLFTFSLNAQKHTISGYIVDQESLEPIIGANIFDTQSRSGTTSNTYGFFSYSPSRDTVQLNISYVGYRSIKKDLVLDGDLSLEIQLEPMVELQEVEVVASREQKEISVNQLPLQQIKKLPAILGEPDLLKTVQFLPGVQAGSEGQTGFYVRGGSLDQNLILMDGVPIYYSSHALGFISAFNTDAIKKVTLTKGGFPARFGGRLSSVLEINMKEGDLNNFHGEGAIGIINSKLTLEGPIKKGKSSFLISGRRTYLDLLARPFIKKLTEPNENTSSKPRQFFYDLNMKIQQKINEDHRLFLSVYSGSDVFSFQFKNRSEVYENGLDWGNQIAALRWNWKLNNKFFIHTNLNFSQFNTNIISSFERIKENEENELFSYIYRSGIKDIGLNINADYSLSPAHYLKFGISTVRHRYTTGAANVQSDLIDVQLDTLLGNAVIPAIETDIYVEDEISWRNIKANLGLHFSNFQVEQQNYFSFQPRISVSYLMKKERIIKLAYSEMAQYINLLSGSSLNLPTDLWVPATNLIKPQTSKQYAIGISLPMKKNLKITVEGFYKKMNNVIAFQEGAGIQTEFEPTDWQRQSTQGEGESYGAEVLLEKTIGKTTGWIAYTLSWNWRKFDDINSGDRFPFRYDRRHDISLVLSHQFNKKITASLAWVYGTGNAVTIPTYRFADDYVINYNNFNEEYEKRYNDIWITTGRNNYRMSDFHRLDLSVSFKKKKKRFERTWIISTYNTYFRANPYVIIPDVNVNVEDRNRSTISFIELSLLPVLIPSVSYNFKF